LGAGDGAAESRVCFDPNRKGSFNVTTDASGIFVYVRDAAPGIDAHETAGNYVVRRTPCHRISRVSAQGCSRDSPLLEEQVSDLAKELAAWIEDLEKFTGAEGDASHFYPDPEIRLPPYTPSEMMSIDEIPIIADVSPYFIENSRDDSEAKTLVHATFDEESADRLHQWMKNNNIPHPVQKSMMRVTLLEHCRTLNWDGDRDKRIDIDAKHLKLGIERKIDSKLLILYIHQPGLHRRKETIAESLGASSLGDSRAHVTMSYDVSGWKFPQRITPLNFPLRLIGELAS
jgi:hypothetical protein